MDANVSQSPFLEATNLQFEECFTHAACISKEMNCIEESQLAAKRVFSFNPDSEIILSLFPEYAPMINILSSLINKHLQTLKKEASNPKLWTLLGYCYLARGDFPNAFASLIRAFQNSPNSDDPDFWYAIGIVYAHYRHYDSSVKCFQTIINITINFEFESDIYFRLGLIERYLEKYDNALECFERAKTRPPNNLLPEDVQLQIAYTLQLQNHFDEARDIYQDLHLRFPNALKITQQYCWFMYLQYKETNLSKVRSIIDQALQSNPYDPTLVLIAARIAMKQEDMATAYQHYRYCILYYGDSPYFWCGLGFLYYKNDQKDDALVAFQRALFLKKETYEAWLNIGLLFELKGEVEHANQIYSLGQTNCTNCPEFQERINCINSPMKKFSFAINDIDDSKFITSIPEQFAIDYLAAVPELPQKCFGIDRSKTADLKLLATYPSSLFS